MDYIDVARYGTIKCLDIPESDRRILELLAQKKEQEKQSERLAYEYKLLWEKAQIERLKVSE